MMVNANQADMQILCNNTAYKAWEIIWTNNFILFSKSKMFLIL